MDANRVQMFVVQVPHHTDRPSGRVRPPARQLLADADPYIARLIRNLQREVRAERFLQRARGDSSWLSGDRRRAEAPLPLGDSPIEFERPDHDDEWSPWERQ